MNTTSFWQDSASIPAHSKIKTDVTVDVAVVGAGITGITAAYLFKKAGQRVALIDRGNAGGFDTTNTTAHLTFVTDTSLQDLVKRIGAEEAGKVWSAGNSAIEQIEGIIHFNGIDCDFKRVPGYYHAPWNRKLEDQKGTLRQEAALAEKLGFQAQYLETVPLVNRPGIHFPHQAKFNPRKYQAALLRTIPGKGSHVFTHTEVEEIQAEPLVVKAGKHKIHCKLVFLATHNPLMGKASAFSATLFQSKLFLYTTYAVGARVASGFCPEACYWEKAMPYHYLRVDRQRDHDYLIFGGEDHKTGQETDPVKAYGQLEQALRKIAPHASIDHRWSGQVIETVDGLPYMGEMTAGQYVATGFAGNGMTFGTLGAMMAVDAFHHHSSPWVELFDVHRKAMGGVGHYLKENADYLYYLGKGWLPHHTDKSLSSIHRNSGKVVDYKGHKAAAYRDAHGKLSMCSAVCTHMKCVVKWNGAEKTWDCPCHGSRFAATGEVLAGPAEKALEPIPAGETKAKAEVKAKKRKKEMHVKRGTKPVVAKKRRVKKAPEPDFYYLPMG